MRNIIRTIILVFLLVCQSSVMAYAAPDNYRVQAEDVLQITVYEHDDLNTLARVSANGKISFPLLEEVQVSGLTVNQIEKLLKKLLEKDYLVKAHVQVFIENYRVKQVTVLGAVTSPGKYDMNRENETTVLEAIAMAGGFTNVADFNGTSIIRKKGETKTTLPIRITDITKKGMKEKDIAVEHGDIIFVPESFF
ncbi:MAG: polysaccharide biosynthesis/export family protein [Candidatus Omnitrophica bacterium]|nr:polysaccharide biosynthesis/export family protein [Candidatus Omnitrophota bacterium]